MNAAFVAIALAGAGALGLSAPGTAVAAPVINEHVDMSKRDSLLSRDTANSANTTPTSTVIADVTDSRFVIWSLVGVGAFAGGAVSVAVARRRARSEVALA